MASDGFTRKLTAVFNADVVGYSRLMEEDEAATVKTLEIYKELLLGLIRRHHGRVVDFPGDNVLAEFASVVDAVEGAVAVQKELQARNADLPTHRRMDFRIGINLGDVIVEGDRIYGDGVNIAARLQALADPGGICISNTVFDHVETKLPLGYEYLGEQLVKNIAKPVEAYKVLLGPGMTHAAKAGETKGPPLRRRKMVLVSALAVVGVILGVMGWHFYLRAPQLERASVARMAFPLPDKPSIAVLPFANLSEDPGQDYLADGITEDIITGLSKVPNLFVIAPNSTFTYKGKPAKIQQVAEELGVRYVLEGSCRRSGDRMRLTAQLIDAITGQYLWAERYDREAKDLFAIQDDIAMRILVALQVQLTEGVQGLIVARGTTNLAAYLKTLQAQAMIDRARVNENALARRHVEEAIALDPGYARPYAMLGHTHLVDVVSGLTESPKESVEEAIELAKKALSLDERQVGAHAVLSLSFVVRRDYENAIRMAEQGVTIEPSAANSHYALGRVLHYASRQAEAVESFRKAIRLNPFPPARFFFNLGDAYFLSGNYEEAIVAYKKAVAISPEDPSSRRGLAAVYGLLGRDAEARAEAAEMLKIDPKWSIERSKQLNVYKNSADLERFVMGWRKAGLK